MRLCAKFSTSCTERFIYAVDNLDSKELVVEDVGPRIAPLLCRFFDLRVE
jgi:hypothetical protein